MSAAPPRSTDELWAITTYFNPQHYRRKLANYLLFRRHLPLPLLTVELSFDGDFELVQEDADVLVQLRGGNVMWQKERLLNIALSALPAACRKVLWTDCDLLFDQVDWLEVRCALNRFPLVQPFQYIHDSAADAPEHSLRDPTRALLTRPSLAFAVHTGQAPADCLTRTTGPLNQIVATGAAWAGRREILAAHGFYDALIAGGGDEAILAAFGCGDELTRLTCLNDRQRAHYLAWARPFHNTVRGAVTFVTGTLFHLWHGALRDRSYSERHRALQRFHFDPYDDIRIGANEVWCWSSNKLELHQALEAYFATRKEDG